jgi:DNA mismatch repair ATPase MutL
MLGGAWWYFLYTPPPPKLVRGDTGEISSYRVAEEAAEYHQQSVPTQNSWGKPLTLLQQRWLLSESAQGILLIDAQTAWRILLVEELLHAYTQEQLEGQPLLFPYSHTATEETVIKLLEQREVLESVGIVLDQLAPNAVMLRSMPHLLNNVDGKKFLLLLSDQLKRSYGQLEINIIFALVAFAEPIMALNNTMQQQNLLDKLHTHFPLQLPAVPSFCLHLSYADLVQRLAISSN